MKKIFQLLLSAGTVLLMMSCNSDAIDDLTGKYPLPDDVTLTAVASQSSTVKADGSARYFNVELTGDNNAKFDAQFCCSNTWYLEARTYTYSDLSGAIIGNFVSDNTSYSSASSSSTIVDGNIAVTRADNNAYTFYGVLLMADQSVVRVHFSGTINYTEPQPEALTQILSAKATAATGYTSIELIIGTDGLSAVANEWYTAIVGNGKYADLTLICASSTIAAGTYTPVAAGSEKAGTFVTGYQGSYGTFVFDAGSRWYTVADNVSSAATYLTAGSIKVAVNGTTYTVTIDSGSVFARYTGTITVQ